jgi:secondary thiamine-phosphate synthase enzyme
MRVIHLTLDLPARGAGLHEITDRVAAGLRDSRLLSGVATVFCRHTSCSLLLMENASPEARRDLEKFFDRLVPASRAFEHALEGPDDMPSHIKMALTRTSESVPFAQGELLLGIWQGIYLWEHRTAPPPRQVLLTYLGE